MNIVYCLSVEDVINQINSNFLFYDTKIVPSYDKAFLFYKRIKTLSSVYIDCTNKIVEGQKILFIKGNPDLISFCKLYKGMFYNTIDLRMALNYMVFLRQLVGKQGKCIYTLANQKDF